MIGYYVHHHGQGHLARASCVAVASGEPVVALSSLPEPAGHPFADWVALPPDPPMSAPDDATAGGVLHWAPLNSPGYRDRMAVLAGWLAGRGPRLVVVDVSVEVTALCRLLGVPTVVVAGPGHRTDDAHQLGYRMASRVLAPWPSFGPVAVPDGVTTPTVFTGAFSRFDELPAPAPAGRGRVLLMLGAGGDAVSTSEVAAARAATAGWTWSVLGGDGHWTDDVWDELVAADVVVTHAGLGALSEVAAARRPAVVVPQDRPFAEQHATARCLDRIGLAQVCDGWPRSADWPGLLAMAEARGGGAWARWNDGHGAQRFVSALAAMPGVDRAA